MNRLLVTLLAAFDAAIAVAVALAAVLAPLTLLWVFGASGSGDWAALWPVSARIWQIGHLVPVDVVLPIEYLTATGIPADAAAFTLSLAPLAFAAFTAVFAARSGARAARAGAWPFGVVAGGLVVATASTLVVFTTQLSVASVDVALAVALPTAVYVVPALAGAVVAAWQVGDEGLVDEVHVAVHRTPRWAGVPAAAAAGTAIVGVGLLGVGGILLAATLVVHAGEVVALYEAANADLLGVTLLSVAHLAYLPTLVIWAASYAAGPGFAIGTGTAVSPSGTSLGVVPGVPVFGAIPQDPSSWLLLLALAVVALGALAGRSARLRLRGDTTDPYAPEPFVPRLVTALAIAVLSAGVAALFAWLASGSMGPGRMADVGPAPGPLALAVAVEVAVGAAILLLAPRLDAAPDGYEPAFDAVPAAADRSRVPVTSSVASLFDDHPDDPADGPAVDAPAPQPVGEAGGDDAGADDETAPLDDAVADARAALATEAGAGADTNPAPSAEAAASDSPASQSENETVPLDELLPRVSEGPEADEQDAAGGSSRPPVD